MAKPSPTARPRRKSASPALDEASLPQAATPDLSEITVRRLVHELEVHQIELEMQNSELRAARDEAESILEKYTDLYDFAPVGYFTLSPDGTILLSNLTGSLQVGIERSRLVGKSFNLLVTREQRPSFQSFLRQVFEEHVKQSIDSELLSRDSFPKAVNIEAHRSPNGRECRVAVIDIAQRKRTEEIVRVSETRYRRLFEAAHDGVLLLDPTTCKITDANPFMTRLLGYPHDQLVGKELFEIGLLKDEAASREMFQKLKTSHEVRYEDLPLESQGGKHQEVEVVANLYLEDGHTVIQCNIRDITARKRAEDIIHRNEVLFAALVAQAPVGVYVVDSGFRMQQVNPTAMAVFQNVQPLIGREFSEVMRTIWPRRVAEEIVVHFRHTLQTGEPYQSPVFAQRRRDLGVKEVYEWQIQRVTLPVGEYGVVCFFNNITERTKTEAAQRRLDVLTASNLKLREEIVRRQAVEESLRETRLQQSLLLKQSRRQQEQLRDLSHRILHAQEEERKRISRELHDVIAQTLVGINVHLAALSQGAVANPAMLRQQVTHTHLLVEKAVDIVHQFARELRPAILDDLGLIPALKTFLKEFMEETGVRVSLTVFAGIEQAPDAVKTVLFRISQEALTNVARHAKANHVTVSIQLIDNTIHLEIKDNGQGFEVNGKAAARKNNRLGLLGMRERVEMIGGEFRVESAPGEPTTVHVEIPAGKTAPKKNG
ncbi:MAG: PAS domain S-box protein [Luteolibacter sp.]